MKKQKSRYIVYEDGVPCGYESTKAIFGSALTGASRTLVKMADKPHAFGGEKSANKALVRAQKLSESLKRTMLDDWARLTKFVHRGAFTVERQ